MQPQVGELLLIELKHKACRKAAQIAVDLLVKPLGGLAVKRCQIGIEHHALAANELDALGDVAKRQRLKRGSVVRGVEASDLILLRNPSANRLIRQLQRLQQLQQLDSVAIRQGLPYVFWRLNQADFGMAVSLQQINCFPSRRGFPRIDDGHASRLEISDVSGDHSHAMHKGGCRDECITLAALVGYMQPGATLCHGCIDRQRAPGELRQYVLL